jgi:hypothetical protein
MNLIKRGNGYLIAAWLMTLTGLANAGTAETAQTTNKLTFGGDFRVRHESFFNKSAGQIDRHRERFRLRFGAKMEMEKWEALVRLASGTGEQTSTNQTMGNSWNQKNIYVDQVFATYKPTEWLKFMGGRMENPFWRLYTSDLVWDADVNPEGFAERVEFDLSPMVSVFGNFGQMPVNEINSGNAADKDPWMYGNQVGVKTTLGRGLRWDFAVADYSFSHETINPLLSTATVDSPVLQGDNRRVLGNGALLAGQFNMLQFTTQLGLQALVPVRLQADYVKNIHPERFNGQDTGYQYGLILGSAKNKGGLEAAYYNKYLEANATLSDFSDSDWGNGGTNRKGHIFILAYGLTGYVTLQGKYFLTKRVDPFIGAAAPYAATATNTPRDINRLQVDLVVKF